ncbi:MAG: beta-galactosidase [Planctomycetes bacterium]|nr:beta-galactosidase [Planctomycetota bacterium]
MSYSTNSESFTLNDKPSFLLSGEIHYFRVERDLWETHLKKACEAGLRTVSTYIPWDWHEPEQGVFDFDGSSHPQRDLKGWISLCQKFGLDLVVKPGPFILAEYRGAGLPDWMMESFGDTIRAQDRTGKRFPNDFVTLFDKNYLNCVKNWYDQILPLINSSQASLGGPITMMQVCNEIGVFSWLAAKADYSPECKEAYHAYLKKTYPSLEELNSQWKTNHTSFEAIELPPEADTPCVNAEDRARDNEWHQFWRGYYGDYLRLLKGWIREQGISIPLYHNLPGWIYGSGWEFPLNITMYSDLYGEKDDPIIFGVDHIPEYSSYRNMHDDRIINDITGAMQGRGPLFAAEFQSGSREYQTVTNPREMELFYKASLAHGLKGWNYYMFSQGKNPEGKGFTGKTFYWHTPLSADGEESSAYPLVKHVNSLISCNEQIILSSKRKADICILFNPHHYSTETEREVRESTGIKCVASSIRRGAYFDGLLRALNILNVDYDMLDISTCSSAELSEYSQVWAFCTDEMAAEEQSKILNYTEAGGHTIVYPTLPRFDLKAQPCTILRDAIGVSQPQEHTVDSPLISLLGINDVKCSNPTMVFADSEAQGGTPIAWTLDGQVCGFNKMIEKGSVLVLGTWLGYDTEDHDAAYSALLENTPSKVRQARSSSTRLTIRQRFNSEGQALLFVGNYHNEHHEGQTHYTHPLTQEEIPYPYSSSCQWPPLYATLTPIRKHLLDDLSLLHTTSDLVNVEDNKPSLILKVKGDRDLMGEIVLEGSSCPKIKKVSANGSPLEIVRETERIIISYSHPHNSYLNIEITL